MKQWQRWTTLLFVVLLMFVPILAFGQDEGGGDPEMPSALAEFLGLLFSGGLTMALVQLLRRLGVVDKVPGFVRPLIAAGIGFGAVWLSQRLGVPIDLSPIAALFAAGGGASLLFGIGKEVKVNGKPLLNSSEGK